MQLQKMAKKANVRSSADALFSFKSDDPSA